MDATISVARILYIAQAGERGGAEAVLLKLLQHVDRTQFEPMVVCLQGGNFVEEIKSEAQVDVTVVPAGRFRDLRRGRRVIRQLVDMIHGRKVHLVHCHGTGAHLYGSLAARMAGVPSVYHLHDVLECFWSKQGLVHLLAILISPTATVAVSHYVADRFQEAWRSSREIQVIHNAVELLETENPKPVLSRVEGSKIQNLKSDEWGWSPHSPVVAWCGRLQPWKGAHVFLEAAALVRQQMPLARFMVVGGTLFGIDAAYQGQLQALATALNLNGSLRFTGHVAEVRHFMAAADVVVHSAIQPEPFGLVVLEAMSLGKPVIASRDGGPAEIVEEPTTGLLVSPRDPKELAQAMIRLLQDQDLRAKMGKAARERAERFFAVSQMTQQVENLYRKLVRQTARFSKDS